MYPKDIATCNRVLDDILSYSYRNRGYFQKMGVPLPRKWECNFKKKAVSQYNVSEYLEIVGKNQTKKNQPVFLIYSEYPQTMISRSYMSLIPRLRSVFSDISPKQTFCIQRDIQLVRPRRHWINQDKGWTEDNQSNSTSLDSMSNILSIEHRRDN